MKDAIFPSRKPTEAAAGYLIAVAASAVIGLVCYPISHSIGYQTVGFLFLMSVPILSLFIGRGPILLATVLNLIVWNFLFIPPTFTFHIGRMHDLIAMIAYFAVALSSGILVTRIRRNEMELRHSQGRIRIINSLLESLNHAGSIREVVIRAQEVISKEFSAKLIVYLKEKQGDQLSDKAFGDVALNSTEGYKAACKALRDSEASEAGIHYYPLAVQRGNIGVIGLKYNVMEAPGLEKGMLMKSFIGQITSALDREINIDIAKEKEIFLESQKLFQTVLSSVSHELKTPIAIISTAISTLDDENTAANPEIRRQVCDELSLAAKRLTILVDNILDMSRIESGYFKLNRQPFDVTELFGVAINEIKPDVNLENLQVDIQENLPSLFIDIHWFKQAIINVLRNAITYTPAGSNVYFKALRDEHGNVVIEILDSGHGVPESSLNKLFEKFYRVPGTKIGGTGLGLAIAKAIVEAHKGLIFALNKEGSGLNVIIIMGKTEND